MTGLTRRCSRCTHQHLRSARRSTPPCRRSALHGRCRRRRSGRPHRGTSSKRRRTARQTLSQPQNWQFLDEQRFSNIRASTADCTVLRALGKAMYRTKHLPVAVHASPCRRALAFLPPASYSISFIQNSRSALDTAVTGSTTGLHHGVKTVPQSSGQSGGTWLPPVAAGQTRFTTWPLSRIRHSES